MKKNLTILCLSLLFVLIIFSSQHYSTNKELKESNDHLELEINKTKIELISKDKEIQRMKDEINSQKEKQGEQAQDKHENNEIGVFPFNEKELSIISLFTASYDEMAIMNLDYQTKIFVFFESLNHLNEKAKANVNLKKLEESNEPIYIVYYLNNDDKKEYRYYVEKNIIVIEDEPFYASMPVFNLMTLLLKPSSIIGDIKRIDSYQALKFRVVHNDELHLQFDRFEVNNKDYNFWERELQNLKVEESFFGFYSFNNELEVINIYEEGIIQLPLTLIFTNNQYKTEDGITVGTTKDEVINRLGQPHYKSDFQWSYRVGDYTKFGLIFENDKVKYIELYMPL